MTLDYDQMLAELDALIGKWVSVEFFVQLAQRRRPLGMVCGVLARREAIDLNAQQEAILGNARLTDMDVFLVGDMAGVFVLRRADYKHGRRRDEVLILDVGKASISIASGDGDPTKDRDVLALLQEWAD